MNITNKFKWLVAMLLAVAVMTLSAVAQNATWATHTSARVKGGNSFLGENVKSLIVSNLVSITNYSIPGTLGGTNVTGVTYTNKNNTRVVTSATVGTNTALLGMVALPARFDGSPAITTWGTTNSGTWAVANTFPGNANISVTLDSSAGADTAALLIFTPVWDGVNPDTTGSFDFSFSTGNLTASSTLTMHTNLPLGRWIGAKALACKSVSFSDTTAGATIAVRALNLNGYGSP